MHVVTAEVSAEQRRQAAGGLRLAGLRTGDRVGVLAYPSADVFAVVLGALRTGIVPVMLDPGPRICPAPLVVSPAITPDRPAPDHVTCQEIVTVTVNAPPAALADGRVYR